MTSIFSPLNRFQSKASPVLATTAGVPPAAAGAAGAVVGAAGVAAGAHPASTARPATPAPSFNRSLRVILLCSFDIASPMSLPFLGEFDEWLRFRPSLDIEPWHLIQPLNLRGGSAHWEGARSPRPGRRIIALRCLLLQLQGRQRSLLRVLEVDSCRFPRGCRVSASQRLQYRPVLGPVGDRHVGAI